MKTLTELKRQQEGYGILIEHNVGYINPKDKINEDAMEVFSRIGSGQGIEIVEPLSVYAVFQKFGVPNANERIYPESVLRKEVERYQEIIKDRRAYGELNHPESVTIDGSRISHNITELWWEGKTLVGRMDIIMSPGFVKYGIVSTEGDRVANYLRLGLKIGVSSRGLGSVEKERFTGKYIVQDDFELTCWDIVTDPSTSQAWIGDTSKDSVNMYKENIQKQKKKLVESLDNFLNKKILL